MVYYFKYFVNTKLTTTTTCKGQIFSCYLIILPKYLCAKVFTFQYTGNSTVLETYACKNSIHLEDSITVYLDSL